MDLIEVGCAVVIKDKKLLIAQRKANDTYGGCWEFPGGKREPDEAMEACLAREVREELGIEIRAREFFRQVDIEYSEKKIALFFYFCDWVSGDPKCLDCQDVRWVSAEGLRGLQFPKGDDGILAWLIQSGRIS